MNLLFLIRGAAASLVATLAMSTFAADWQPRRPIEIVVPSAPGGGLDLIARTLQSVIQQDKLSPRPVTIVNRPGGGGTVALAYVNAHQNDGHYVTVQALPLITNSLTGLSSPGLGDATPLAVLVSEQILFSVPANSEIHDGKQLIDFLKRNPSKVSIAVSSSPGGQSHIAASLLLKAAGQDPRKLKIVFFDSGGEAVTALMGGHVTVAATPAGVILGPSQSGLVRIVGTLGKTRQGGALSKVPTWKEQGVDVDFTTWRAIVGPKSMTKEEVAWWDDVLKRATSSPRWTAAVASNLWSPLYLNSADGGAFLNNEKARLTPLLGELGLSK